MKRDRSRWRAGAAIPETAITIGVCLMLLFGAFEIATIGYMQVVADGAAFLSAHEQALGIGNAATVVQEVFNQVAPSNVTTTTSTVDNTNIPVNYNLTDTTERHGGVALVRPQHVQTQVTEPNVGGILVFDGAPTQPVSVRGSFIEPNNVIVDPGFDVAGSDPNSVQSTDTSTYASDTLNEPPFMVGIHLFQYCPPPAQGTTQYANQPCNGGWLLSVGLAEFLDTDNYPIDPDSPLGVQAGQTFQAMLCHQQVFAKLESDFPATFPYAAGATPAPNATIIPAFDEGSSSSDFHQLYGEWDYNAGSNQQLEMGGGASTPPLQPYSGCPPS